MCARATLEAWDKHLTEYWLNLLQCGLTPDRHRSKSAQRYESNFFLEKIAFAGAPAELWLNGDCLIYPEKSVTAGSLESKISWEEVNEALHCVFGYPTADGKFY